MYGIARRFGLSVDELKRINNLSSNTLSIGQVLKVSLSNSEGENEGIQYYIVQPGDNLYKIATMYGLTVDELKAANNLTSNLLSIGQNLIIPSKALVSNEVYQVQPGDTLYSIARKFNTTVTAIQSLNNLTTSVLSIGQKLLIP